MTTSTLTASRVSLPIAPRTQLVVIVLQWGRVDETLRCLDALRKSRGVRFETVVVDNASPEPNAATRVRKRHTWVRIVENSENLGFAGGNNVVLESLVEARQRGRVPRWVLLLNNDVEVEPSCLARMLRVAESRDAAAVGAINFLRGSNRIGSSGGFITWPSGRYRDAAAGARAVGDEPFEVQTLSGSTLMLDLDALAEVGVLDPEYFCVYEETDLCLRLGAAGHRLLLAPDAHAFHAVGASTSRRLHFYFRFRNRIRFVRSHGGRGARWRLLPALAAELTWRLPAYVLTGRPGDAWGILRGVWDGLRGAFGPGPFVGAARSG